eukprot:13659725-Alexandrium_andersonii.AAC.1
MGPRTVRGSRERVRANGLRTACERLLPFADARRLSTKRSSNCCVSLQAGCACLLGSTRFRRVAGFA